MGCNAITESVTDFLFLNICLFTPPLILFPVQNIVSQIVGALSSHGASGTVSAEATATVSHRTRTWHATS